PDQRIEREQQDRRIAGPVRDAHSSLGVGDSVASSRERMQTARPGDQAERLVLWPPFRATLLDAVSCRGDGLVDGVTRERQLGPGLSQTELPQPLVPAGGARFC